MLYIALAMLYIAVLHSSYPRDFQLIKYTRTLSDGYFMLQYFVVIRQRYEKYFLNTDLSWM